MASSQDIHIEHPNGSDGWLPAETVLKEDSDPHRRSTIATSKRKKPFASTHSAAQQQEVNGTTPAVDESSVDDDLKSRVVTANNILTPKQRSKIAKSEGQSQTRDRPFLR